MARTRTALLAECRKRLLKTKQDLMNGLQSSKNDIEVMSGGDEADQAADFQQKAAALAMRESALRQIREIDAANGPNRKRHLRNLRRDRRADRRRAPASPPLDATQCRWR